MYAGQFLHSLINTCSCLYSDHRLWVWTGVSWRMVLSTFSCAYLLFVCKVGFPGNSVGKESTYNAGDPSSIPGLGRCTGEGVGYPLQYSWASLVAQLVKNLPAMQETWVLWSLGWDDPLEKRKATHSGILAWRIPLTEESIGSQKWQIMLSTFSCAYLLFVYFLSKNCLFKSFAYFYIGLLVFLLCSKNSLNIPDTSSLSDKWFASISFHFIGCLFTFLTVLFAA